MNGVTPKSQKGSPKTPGGISKSLLTPCRRVGLSRKWRKSGCSPFISPLSAHTPETPERKEIREVNKRKKFDIERHTEGNDETTNELDELPVPSECSPISRSNSNEHKTITLTPRNSEIPRKKSKLLSLSLKKSQETDKDEVLTETQLQPDILFKEDICRSNEIISVNHKVISTPAKELKDTHIVEQVKPIRSNSKENVTKLVRTESRSKKLSLKKSLSKSESKDTSKVQQSETNNLNTNPKEKSPNNLTKECIVVIQKKIFKTDPHTSSNKTENIIHNSDSETDIPLSVLKEESNLNVTLNTLDDNDFINKPLKKKRNLSMIRNKTTNHIDSTSSQSSQEDTEKRTILVKKTYEKVIKPQKAKSTGSITQKDIDDLKARIEMKKKHLLAKAMSVDTEELRGLIKKWQKGCQDALMELLDLMKKKLPDRQNMDYAEMLEALKIPAQLVGYDSENDCFITPDDNNVLLSAFKL